MIEIRPLQPQDRISWELLWRGYQEFYKIALKDEVTNLTWQRLLDMGEPMFALGAFQDDTLVGITHFHFYRSTGSSTHTCYLQDLFTIPEMRGKGIARALIEAVVTAAKSHGAETVFWHTHQTNTSARLLYDKVAEDTGYKHYRIKL